MPETKDPQLEVDATVTQNRPTRADLAAQWRSYLDFARAGERIDTHREDLFGAALNTARAEVLLGALELIHKNKPLEDAAAELMKSALHYSVRTPPLIGYDEAAINYTKARKLQQCAWDIDPDLSQVQAPWGD